jgi:hypothetical protein
LHYAADNRASVIPAGPVGVKPGPGGGDVLFNDHWLGSADQLDEVV